MTDEEREELEVGAELDDQLLQFVDDAGEDDERWNFEEDDSSEVRAVKKQSQALAHELEKANERIKELSGYEAQVWDHTHLPAFVDAFREAGAESPKFAARVFLREHPEAREKEPHPQHIINFVKKHGLEP